MGATTPHLNLYKPGGGSSGTILPDERVDIDRINGNMDLIDTWSVGVDTKVAVQDTRNQQFTGPAAGRTGMTGMKLGDTYQETDGNKKFWRYDGTNWLANENGMFLVTPASVSGTGATINARGEVVLANASGFVNIDGCVPAGARKLCISIIIDSTTTTDHQVYLRLRASGADVGGSTYYTMTTEERIGNGPNRQELSAAADWVIGITRTNGSYHEVELASMESAKRKFMHYRSIDASMYQYVGSGSLAADLPAVTGIRLGLHATSGDTGIVKITAVI